MKVKSENEVAQLCLTLQTLSFVNPSVRRILSLLLYWKQQWWKSAWLLILRGKNVNPASTGQPVSPLRIVSLGSRRARSWLVRSRTQAAFIDSKDRNGWILWASKVLDWGRSGTCWCVLRAIVAIYFLVNFSTLYFLVNSHCALSICSYRAHWPTAVILTNVCFHLVRCLDQRSGRMGKVSSLESRVNPGVKELPWPCMGTKGSCCPSVSLWGSFGVCVGGGICCYRTLTILSKGLWHSHYH